jgi:pimeloyl-ACP methyl ester carboxylesterase
MGGWLMLLATLARPAQVHALIGIAAAPDFTKDLSKLSSQQQADLETKGICYFQSTAGENTYPLTREFLADAGQHYVLDSHLPIACPVHLLHGMRDDIVDWRQSVKLAKHLNNDNVILTLIKDGDHRLSREQDLERLQQVLKNYT